jgi:hypothetical protein
MEPNTKKEEQKEGIVTNAGRSSTTATTAAAAAVDDVPSSTEEKNLETEDSAATTKDDKTMNSNHGVVEMKEKPDDAPTEMMDSEDISIKKISIQPVKMDTEKDGDETPPKQDRPIDEEKSEKPTEDVVKDESSQQQEQVQEEEDSKPAARPEVRQSASPVPESSAMDEFILDGVVRYPKRSRKPSLDAIRAAEREKKEAEEAKKKKKAAEVAKKEEPPTPPPGPPPDANVGRYVEQQKLLGTTTGQYYPLNGKIVEYQPAEGRIPPRYSVQWEHPDKDDVIQKDEWVAEDLNAFQDSVAKGTAPIMTYSAYKSSSSSHHPPPLKMALENVRQRYQQVVEHDLESGNLLSTLILFAALEEALQTGLQYQQQKMEESAVADTTTTTTKKSSSTPHPPLYYTANPSSYLQAPSDDSVEPSSSSSQPKAQMTPAVLAQRLRQGCQWAWTYLQSKQPPSPLLEAPIAKRAAEDSTASYEVDPADAAAIAAASADGSSVAQRRSVRAVRMLTPSAGYEPEIGGSRTRSSRGSSTMAPGVIEPNPVQKGGRIAMWWIKALEDGDFGTKEAKEQEPESDQDVEMKDADLKEVANVPQQNGNVKGKGKKVGTNKAQGDGEMVDESFDDEEQDEETKGEDDEDYSAADDGEQDDDEPLENVERERGKLSPVASSHGDNEEVDGDDDNEEVDSEQVDEEVDEEQAIVWENPYLQSSFPALLEFLARPKSISLEEVQKAMDEVTLRVRHNKRTAEHGLPVADLAPFDQVILDLENPDYPSNGKVVLKCVSGESAGELQRLDANTFGRCKFELEILGEVERAIQIQRKEEFLKREMEYKERKAWDRWRYRGIQEGYAIWPSWQDSAEAWVKENVASTDGATASVPTAAAAPAPESEETKNDEALAKSLEESEAASGGRRRTARRAAAANTEGVFYGNQSQLTQKQLVDALLRLIRVNPFQTLMRLQSLVADDSSDPIRRCRIAIGKMLWKRNLIARKAVMSTGSDLLLSIGLSTGKHLIELKPSNITEEEQQSEELPQDAKDLLQYISSLHQTEIKLRSLVLKQLADIPIPVIATAADERIGSVENMDDNDFEDPSTIEWKESGHSLLGKLIYRPPTQSILATEQTTCNWYRIKNYSESIKSEADDAEQDAMERRMRFRAEAAEGPDDEGSPDGEELILTEAQVHAGLKAAEMQKQQHLSSSRSNPYARLSGDVISLVPIDDGEDDNGPQQPFQGEIRGRIVAHDSIVDPDDETDIEYRILILPQPDKETQEPKPAFWAVLDIRADDSSWVCQPEGQSTWYAIENQDFHQDSEAYRECEKILTWLSSQSKAAPFMVPVDPVALGIPHYPEMIKHPMDISTITDKLENGHYSSIPPSQSYGHSPACRMLNGPFRSDIELMFDNAISFNPSDDWIHQAAVSLKKSCIRKIETASSAAERAFRNSGARQKKSMYTFDDSDQDMYEYESDQDEEYGGKSRKRKRGKAQSNKDEPAARPLEHAIRLHSCLKDGNDLRGKFSNLPVNTDASTYSLPPGWNCRKRLSDGSKGDELLDKDNDNNKEDGVVPSESDNRKQEMAKEMSYLLDMQKAFGEDEEAVLRRSTRSHDTSERSSSKVSRAIADLEYFPQNSYSGMSNASFSEDIIPPSSPSSRKEMEMQLEKKHEEYYSKLFQKYEKELAATDTNGMYINGSFPPYLGRVIPSKNQHGLLWEIRSAFAVPALRWVIRGLINSGHLTAIEPMTSDTTSGIIITNDIYYYDPSLQPFEILDVRELQRKKRADNAEEEESEDEIEMSEYEKLRAERVARNAERLKALGLA